MSQSQQSQSLMSQSLKSQPLRNQQLKSHLRKNLTLKSHQLRPRLRSSATKCALRPLERASTPDKPHEPHSKTLPA